MEIIDQSCRVSLGLNNEDAFLSRGMFRDGEASPGYVLLYFSCGTDRHFVIC